MNKILSPAERRALKARAHPLKPTVMIGNDGLTAGVLQEIDSTLKAHELIKIRVDIEDSDEREDLLGAICANTGSSAIDHIGKVLVVYRERPQAARAANGNIPGRTAGREGRRGGSPGAAGGPGGAAAPGGQRRPGKKAAGAVWTKVRPAQQRRKPGGGQGNRGGRGGRGGQGGQGGQSGGSGNE